MHNETQLSHIFKKNGTFQSKPVNSKLEITYAVKNLILHIDLPYLPINVINFGGLTVSRSMESK
jgi:hypothetical protein